MLAPGRFDCHTLVAHSDLPPEARVWLTNLVRFSREKTRPPAMTRTGWARTPAGLRLQLRPRLLARLRLGPVAIVSGFSSGPGSRSFRWFWRSVCISGEAGILAC